MKYLPVLQELFESDSLFFLLIGLIASIIIGLKIKESRKKVVCIFASFILYCICEGVSNIRTNNMIEILLLFIGTISIGTLLGFIVSFLIFKLKNRNKINSDLPQ